MIKAENLSMRFGARLAVRDVSFQVTRGEVVGFLGPNGAGKSTTMRMLTGCLEPQAGTAEICGYDIRSARRKAQSSIGYLPEAAGSYPHLRVGEFLTYCAEARGLGGAAARKAIREVAEEIHLQSALDTTMSALSKGWRQRAWLAQALLHDPPVLILDEPTDGLDPIQKELVRRLIRGLAARKAVLLSTHILEEAEEVCSRVIVIRDGAIVADQPTAQLVDKAGRLTPAFHRLTDGSDAPDLAAGR